MAVVVGWRPPIAERMLQTGLRDILSSIVGRIAALGHALAAHDIALWPLAWLAGMGRVEADLGVRPPPACHALRLRSLCRVSRRSGPACPMAQRVCHRACVSDRRDPRLRSLRLRA